MCSQLKSQSQMFFIVLQQWYNLTVPYNMQTYVLCCVAGDLLSHHSGSDLQNMANYHHLRCQCFWQVDHIPLASTTHITHLTLFIVLQGCSSVRTQSAVCCSSLYCCGVPSAAPSTTVYVRSSQAHNLPFSFSFAKIKHTFNSSLKGLSDGVMKPFPSG